MAKTIISDYLHCVLTADGMHNKVSQIVKKIQPYCNKFDAIAFRGVSGALIAPSVAQQLYKDIIVVRKNDSRHSQLRVEGVKCNRYIIVDDFVADGKTIKSIRTNVAESELGCRLVGVVLYNEPGITQEELKILADRFKVWFFAANKPAPVYPTPKKVKNHA